MRHLAIALLNQEKLEEAEAIQRTVLKGRTAHLGEKHPDTICSLYDVAQALSYQKKNAEAAEFYFKGLTLADEVLPKSHYMPAYFHLSYGSMMSRLGRHEEAEAYLLKSHKLFQTGFGETDPRRHMAISFLAEMYEAWEKPEQAAAWRKRLED